jgi:5-methylcytosine-specific restriction endonuclease McrA
MALKEYRATSHWKKLRLQVLRRDAYTCYYCGDVANEVDHVVPKVKGGEDSLDNCVAACRKCNILKKDKDQDVFLARRSTPPAFPNSLSPKRTNQSKSVQNGHTSVRIDPESPFISPDQLGAN